ncbi:hypothetical protein Tco_0953866 [Tanacetum coccineum]|uniref:Synaptobrevin, longin-like domain protein n=1 Tax=Tanacetum coccineum TaxID=301880 RepID=A0ABQ5E3G0_9ASTR
MTNLKFADTHNMVAFLSKPTESEGFEQIVDFLNAHTIKYALTVNPTIYTSRIEQLWAIVKAKTVNREVQLQALVDEKKIIITESIVRRDLQLEDVEGVDYLPNATIFEQLTLIGYEKLSRKLTFYKAFFSPQWKFLIHTVLQCLSAKSTAWNEFSITMASAIICLATNQKFNFLRYIFESMVKNLDNAGKILMYPRKKRPRKSKRKDTEIPQSSGPTTNVTDEAVNEEMDDSLVRDAITATGIDVEKDSGNIDKTQSKATLNESSSSGTSSGSGPRLKLEELMAFCITLQTRVLALEITKTTQAYEIDSLKRRVKRLEKKDRKRTHKLKRLYKVGLTTRVESFDEEGLGEEDASKQGRRIHDIDADEDITLVNVAKEVIVVIEKAKLVSAAKETVNFAATTVSTASTIPVTDVEITLAQALAELKSAKPKADKVKAQDKGKGIMVEEHVVEQVKPMKRLEQMRLDEELAFKLQAEEEEERLAREKAQQVEEANIAWDDVRLFVQFLEQRRKHFAAKRAKEKRNRPPTRALQRSIMYTYLKNMKGWKPKDLKNKSFANIQELFDKAMKRVNTFVDYKTELVEESSKKADAEIAQEISSKRTGDELEQESSKRQKLEEDKESEELKQCLEIIPDDGDDVTIDATPLSTKSPTIVDYKIYKEGEKNYFQIIRADGKTQMYLTFGKMLKNFDREDLEVLWSITMFEHHVEDNVWKNEQGLVKVLNWKLYDSCGVHCITMQNMLFYLLVEKMYPLTNHTLHQMFNDVKLKVDYECEIAFELLRLVKKQLKEGYDRPVIRFIELSIFSLSESLKADSTIRVNQYSIWIFFVMSSSEVRSLVNVSSLNLSGSFWLGDVDLLLVTFNSQLKIFDSLLNNHASGEHSQCCSKVGNIIAREIGEPILNNKDRHVLDVIDTKLWEVAFLECVKFVIYSSYTHTHTHVSALPQPKSLPEYIL